MPSSATVLGSRASLSPWLIFLPSCFGCGTGLVALGVMRASRRAFFRAVRSPRLIFLPSPSCPACGIGVVAEGSRPPTGGPSPMLRRGSLAMATSGSVHERRDEVIVLNCHARPGHRKMLDRAERSAVRRLGTRRMKWRESRVFACTGFLGQSRPHGSRVRRPHRRQVTHTPTHSQRGKVQSLMRNTHSRTHPFSHPQPQADIR